MQKYFSEKPFILRHQQGAVQQYRTTASYYHKRVIVILCEHLGNNLCAGSRYLAQCFMLGAALRCSAALEQPVRLSWLEYGRSYTCATDILYAFVKRHAYLSATTPEASNTRQHSFKRASSRGQGQQKITKLLFVDIG